MLPDRAARQRLSLIDRRYSHLDKDSRAAQHMPVSALVVRGRLTRVITAFNGPSFIGRAIFCLRHFYHAGAPGNPGGKKYLTKSPQYKTAPESPVNDDADRFVYRK
jgi:hypothetical protein